MALQLVAVLPGIRIRESVESSRYVLLHPGDRRYRKIKADDPAARAYLSAFTTPFGRRFEPTMIAFRRRVARAKGADLVAFRDCIAISAIVEARRQTALSGRPRGFAHSESFEVYPVTPGTDSESVYLQTPTERGLHDLSALQAQSPPIVLHPEHREAEFDHTLLRALVRLVDDRTADDLLRQRVLRSLHTAYLASRAPFSHFGDALDHGLLASLWVSAFEILCHPGAPAQVDIKHVREALKAIPWPDGRLRRMSRKPIPTRNYRPKPTERTTPPVQLYARLYSTRNAFLHGEPDLSAARLHLRDGRRGRLDEQIPTLFRFLLLHVLAEAGYHTFPRSPVWRERPTDKQRKEFIAALGVWRMEYQIAWNILSPTSEAPLGALRRTARR